MADKDDAGNKLRGHHDFYYFQLLFGFVIMLLEFLFGRLQLQIFVVHRKYGSALRRKELSSDCEGCVSALPILKRLRGRLENSAVQRSFNGRSVTDTIDAK
jgi:hypothetical protein